MTLDDVPANTYTTLTPELDRLFKFAQCTPQCHSCEKFIKLGQKFTLATWADPWYCEDTPYDHMLCYKCTVDTLATNTIKRREAYHASLRGGYTRVTL